MLMYTYYIEGKNYTEILIRCINNRKDAEDGINIYDKIENSDPLFCTTIDIPRKSYRPKQSKQKKQEKVEHRTAKVEIYACKVLLNPPFVHKDKNPIQINLIYINEIDSYANANPVCWRLLTSMSIEIPEEILECIRVYKIRW